MTKVVEDVVNQKLSNVGIMETITNVHCSIDHPLE